MNTVGIADGVLRTWFDVRLVLDQHDVVYRTEPKVHVTHLDRSIFPSGHSSALPTWSHTSYVDLGDLAITPGQADVARR